MSRIFSRLSAIAALGAAVLSTGLAAAQDEPPVTPEAISAVEQDGAYVFKTDDGLAVYTFDNDPEGASACNGPCATAWPPVAAEDGAEPLGEWTIVTRDDGSSQWAYKGKPVYTFQADTPESISGDGMGGVWHLARP